MENQFQNCLGFRFRKLSRIIDLKFREKLKDHSITENQLTILFVLKKNGETDQGKVAQKVQLQRSTISRNVLVLVKAGFISKTTNYRPAIKLTDKGNELVTELIPIWNGIMNELITDLGEEGLKSVELIEEKLVKL